MKFIYYDSRMNQALSIIITLSRIYARNIQGQHSVTINYTRQELLNYKPHIHNAYVHLLHAHHHVPYTIIAINIMITCTIIVICCMFY